MSPQDRFRCFQGDGLSNLQILQHTNQVIQLPLLSQQVRNRPLQIRHIHRSMRCQALLLITAILRECWISRRQRSVSSCSCCRSFIAASL
jgi:hypothetical protein